MSSLPNKYLALALLLSVGVAAQAFAAETLVETAYLVEGFKPDLKVPVPTPEWKIYTQRKIQIGKKVIGIEELEGPNKGTVTWNVGKKVVSIPGGKDPVVFDKRLDESISWESPETSIAWIKGQEPFHKEKQSGREILVYGNPEGASKLLWLDAETKTPIVQVEGRLVTFFEKKKEDRDIEAPEFVTKILAEEKRLEQKVSEYGAMPK